MTVFAQDRRDGSVKTRRIMLASRDSQRHSGCTSAASRIHRKGSPRSTLPNLNTDVDAVTHGKFSKSHQFQEQLGLSVSVALRRCECDAAAQIYP